MSKETKGPSENGRAQSPINKSGSDFAMEFFSPEENQQWVNLLRQLRAFEAAVCHAIRRIEANPQSFPSLTERMAEMETKVANLEETENMDDFGSKERIIALEATVSELTEKIRFTEYRINRKIIEAEIKLRSDIREIRNDISDLRDQVEAKGVPYHLTKLREELSEIRKDTDILRGRVELLEMENPTHGSTDSEYIDNGHNGEGTRFENGASKAPPKPDDECEVMVSDIFVGTGKPLGQYDGNPSVSFSNWIQRFKDMLDLTTNLNDSQKISRLRFCLMGRAREELDAADPAPTTLETAITLLKAKFENSNTRSIARQAMSICQQAPGEPVFEFANRLNEVVRAALAGENETVIRQRLLDEFMDRLQPDLGFEIKAQRPDSYSRAYELAQHFELLLAGKRAHTSGQVSVAELTQKVAETLTLNRENTRKETRVCYFCRKAGHLLKDCHTRKRQQRKSQYNGYSRNDNYREGIYRTPSRERHYNRYDRSPSREKYYQNRSDSRESRYSGRRDNFREYSRGRDRQNYGNESRDRYRTRSREHRKRSPTPGVRFGERGTAPARIAQGVPYLLVILTILLTLMGGGLATFAIKPMVCLPDAPNSLWRLPEDPICPTSHWHSAENPLPAALSIYRSNTVKYKTPATSCKCVKTIINRKRGLFGGKYENTDTEAIEIPSVMCTKMKDLNQSMAGEMKLNGTMMATNNSLEVGWPIWPVGIIGNRDEVINCYSYDTVVFTRFGADHISTPLETCPHCSYKGGTCICPQGTLIWKPEESQQCAWLFMSKWRGHFANSVWLSDSGDFALSFEKGMQQEDCQGRKYMLSEQEFAIPMEEYNEMLWIREITTQNERKQKHRSKRTMSTRAKSDLNSVLDTVGVVYSPQLAAQLTGLSTRLTRATQQLFTEAVKHVCVSLQHAVDQTLTLAIANPTLLARYLLNNTLIRARLVSEKVLEVYPCLPIDEQGVHVRWEKGYCFDKIPVTFLLHGAPRHGFMDPVTSIIYPGAVNTNCEFNKRLYIPLPEGGMKQFDQETGEIKLLPREEVSQLVRFGNIDIPELSIPIFKNKVLANITEMFSQENFAETVEVAQIHQQIIQITHPRGIWEDQFTIKTTEIAGNIVSTGLFSFIKNGIFSANQVWVFACCVYVTATVLIQFLLPPILAGLTQYMSLGNLVYKLYTLRKKRQMEQNNTQETGQEMATYPSRRNPTPLAQRWPSSKELALIASISDTECDDNLRVQGKINDLAVINLLDTGAAYSICGNSTAKKLGLKDLHLPEIRGVVGIGNELVPALGQIEVNMEIAKCRVRTPLIIINSELGKVGQYDIIIGRKTLRQFPLMLNFQTGELINTMGSTVLALDREQGTVPNFMNNLVKESAVSRLDAEKLEHCLRQNIDVFAQHDYDLGQCRIYAPPIQTTTEIPVTARPYRVPEKYKTELKAHIKEMIRTGVLKKSNTPWVSPIVVVQKTDGNLRPCVDFRSLNAITITDPYPIPRMESVINRVAGHKWYSSLDLNSGFWQIPLEEQTAHKCGIITEEGVYEMTKLPFGLKNAPSVFQRVIDEVIENIPHVTVYIDDILIHTNSVEEHLETLKAVFKRLRDFNLKLKPRKCKLLQKRIEYLGHNLTELGFEPSLANIEVIKKFPEPTNFKELRRFIGLTSFFRKFIYNFAEKSSPLTSISRGKIPEFTWEKPQKEAFEKLKYQLTKAPCLMPPNYKRPFHIFTDASSIAYAGALLQNGDEYSTLHAVAYCSKTLSSAEEKLPATHGELGAIVYALNIFKPIIYRSEIILHTDHRPLTFLFAKASNNAKINRWLLQIQELDVKIVYVEGKANKIADALSRVRIPWSEISIKMKEEMPQLLLAEEDNKSLSLELLAKRTKEDRILTAVIAAVRDDWSGEVTPELEPYYKCRGNLYVDKEVVKKRPNAQIVVPQTLQIAILKLVHRGHFGIVRTKSKARRFFWWPNMAESIEDYVSECVICQRHAHNPPRTDPIYKWPGTHAPLERVHVDFAGPIFGCSWLITVDSYSKFIWVEQMTSTTSHATIGVLREIFAEFGLPKTLVSDNGPQFCAEIFDQFIAEHRIVHIKAPSYHPSSNGAAEKAVQTYKRSMKKLMDEGHSTKDARLIFLEEYRSSPNTQTGETPANLMLGREMRTLLGNIKISEKKWEKEQRTNMDKEGEKMVHKQKEKVFAAGDEVWTRKNKENWKIGVVLDEISPRVYKVVDEFGGDDTFHIDQLRSRRTALRN